MNNPTVSAVCLIATILIMILFGGFYSNLDSIPAGIRWLQHLSFIRYGYVAMMELEFDGLTFGPAEELPDGSCPISTGQQRLELLGVTGTIASDILILALVGVVFRFLAYWALRFSRPRFKGLLLNQACESESNIELADIPAVAAS